jgi:HEAT repeat protein
MASHSPAARRLWRVLRQNDVEGLRDALLRLDTNDAATIRPLLYGLRTRLAIRQEIGDSLKRYGERGIVALIGSLQGTAPHWAGELLAKFGEPAVPALVDALRGRNAQARQWAADILGRIADGRAVEPLREAASDPSSNVRFHAIQAIARINPIAGRREIASAAERDPDWGVRRKAIMILAKQNPGYAVGLLAEQAANPEIGRLACVALRGLGDDGLLALQRLIGGTREVDRINAALALGWRDRRAISILVAVVADKTADIRRRLDAGYALWPTSDPKAMEVNFRILIDQSENVLLRAMAAHALQGAAGADYRIALSDALGDADPLVRAAAIYGLSSGQYPNAVDKIVPKLGDQNVHVRTSAASALSWLGDPRALDPLLRALGDAEWNVRVAVLDALGSLRDRRAIPAIEDLLTREADRFVREVGLRVLNNLRMSGG